MQREAVGERVNPSTRFMQIRAAMLKLDAALDILRQHNAPIVEDIKAGHSYKLGATTLNPAGHFGINPTGLTVVQGVTPLVAGTDYTIDLDGGIISFVEGSAIAVDGVDITVTYAIRASSRSRVISGSEPVEGAMIYRTRNPKGDDVVFFMPYVKITPNGDYALKGDEWQTIPLSLEILKPTTGEAFYRDGTPAYV